MNKNRRRFLQSAGVLGGVTGGYYAGASLPPFAKLVQVILQSRMSEASALSDIDTYYVGFSMFGAPGRWVFDHMMQTKPSDAIMSNPMVMTRLAGSGAGIAAEYAHTSASNGMLVPWMWETNGTSASGGQRPLKPLLDHMITFRGYGTGVDGHPSNMIKQYAPVGSLGSISGYMADHSSTLLRSVQYPAHYSGVVGYRSMKGIGRSSVNLNGPTGNLLNQMLHSFVKRPDLKRTEDLRARYQGLMERAEFVLKKSSEGLNANLSVLNEDHDSALNYLSQGMEDLNAAWAGLYGKYLNILNSTYRSMGVPRFTDQPIISSDDGNPNESRFGVLTNGVFSLPTPGYDMRNMINTADCYFLAQSLAFTEFVLTRKLSHSIDVGVIEPQGLQALISRQGAATFAPELRTFGMVFDEHLQGQITSVLLNSCFYRAFAAGILELVDVLKASGIFNRTVLHIASEFGRAPRVSGGGSDHLFDGMVSSVITGRRVGGPMVVGNILRDATSRLGAGYAGTIGYKASTSIGSSSEILTPSHVASSIAHILGFKEIPWGNIAAPLVAFDGSNTTARASGDVV